MKSILKVMLVLCFVSSSANAALIISSSGSVTNGSSISATQFNAIEFTLNNDLINVAIDASLFSFDAQISGMAYLTTAVGPGATLADVVSSQSFMFVQGDQFSIYNVALFSGLSLMADTYYLVFASDSDVSGYISAGATYTVDPVAAVNGMRFSAGSNLNNTFAPASTFTNSSLGNRFFNVTGDLAEVPAPATLALLAIGLVLIGRKQK